MKVTVRYDFQKDMFTIAFDGSLGYSIAVDVIAKLGLDDPKSAAQYISDVMASTIAGHIKMQLAEEFTKLDAFNKKQQLAKWEAYFAGDEEAVYGITPSDKIIGDLKNLFPILGLEDVPCPVDDCSGIMPMSSLIIHLNDSEHWSREDIAEWLENSDYNINIKE